MAQWINVCSFIHMHLTQLPLLCEKTGAVALIQYGKQETKRSLIYRFLK